MSEDNKQFQGRRVPTTRREKRAVRWMGCQFIVIGGLLAYFVSPWIGLPIVIFSILAIYGVEPGNSKEDQE